MMRFGRLWRVASRLVAVVGFVLGGIILAASYRVVLGRRWYLRSSGQRLVQRWMQGLARALNLRVAVGGALPDERVLLVANHVSWLDIIALNAVTPMTFLSKDGVRAWPLVGSLAAMTGTLFLRRGSLSAMNGSMNEIEARLRCGHRVTLFPEGTTSDGSAVLPFHRALLRSAGRAQVPLQPVAIAYRRDGMRDRIAPFVGDDDFLSHLIRLLAAGPVDVCLAFCEPLNAIDVDNRVLAQWARACIVEVLDGETHRVVNVSTTPTQCCGQSPAGAISEA